MARRVMEQIVEKGRVERGRIGISLRELSPSADGARSEGARIAEVSPGSPAEIAGVRKGDIVLKADDRPIHSAAQLRNRIGLARIGEQVRLTVERSGAAQTVTVAVGPASEANGDHSSIQRQ
jgi:serine protease Do